MISITTPTKNKNDKNDKNGMYNKKIRRNKYLVGAIVL